ncbi:DEAD/DEAH box helicase family protein [Flavobacterium weaverense]|uniref:Type I restriction enzyme R subunit n=1 Tax=Flavobacterium weaverense TaxID=271156 RepID=A0A3L9ZQF6_9FLAO|nr:DEAD/DEAH box helicase family protein [Flavobacterium weaverense]RMA75033.1 type I restriction enzyme R subunit [Flavobacterium weaverense]
MQSNFTFLHQEFPEIYREIVEAEKHTFTAPRYAALLCRSTLEKTMFWLYKNDEDLELPYDTKLGALLHNESFKNILKPSMLMELDIIRLNGNNAAHGKTVKALDALQSLKNSFRFLTFLSKYYSENNPNIPAFEEGVIPYGDTNDKNTKQLQALAEKLEQERAEAQKALKLQEKLAEENDSLRKQLEEQLQLIAERKEVRFQETTVEQAIPELTSEHNTRLILINLLLREAGWDNFREGREIEFEVIGMPLTTNPSGKGFVDYVLWGDNGLPLAVVEAKSTIHSAAKGKHQASLYADCLEKSTGQRPVIFYSNGFETHLWDDTFYPDRKVQGFYTKEELQLLIERRFNRTDLREFRVNTDIAGRYYQLEAIQRVAESMVTNHQNRLKGKSRKALLVMATGSGKTRTAAAMVDMFTKCNWAKKILFLADRTALVTQAKNAFKEHLPHLSAIDLTKEKEDNGTRVVFSTYKTILNKIDNLKNEDERFYGVGHFDVIIIDEAHRSVYSKYQSIFSYFDSILLGLTATPKKDIDHNTYSLFEIEDDNPTYAYELNKAVADNFLKPPHAFKIPLKFPREGIVYEDLSEADKTRFREIFGVQFGDENEVVNVNKNQINTWLYNNDTIDKVLDYLMTNGQKVAGGDKIGKTIVFAKNHKHAVFIEERFNKNYPQYGGNFLRVIDNYEEKAQDLLEKFCFDKGDEKDPQIAVSVDMMDTGVDAPRVLNLVFFKEVKSFSKYWQMIGRGTRLCPDIFEPGKDKEYFLLFDFCGNFEYFGDNPDGETQKTSLSLSQQTFNTKLKIVMAVRLLEDPTAEQDNIQIQFTDDLHQLVDHLDDSRFEVRKHWRYVKEYKNRERWNNLIQGDILNIQNNLSHLVDYNKDKDEFAKRFDLLVYKLQLALITGNKAQVKHIENIFTIANMLFTKRNIPAVQSKITTIKKIQNEQFWSTVNEQQLEEIRQEIRELLQFLKDEKKLDPIYTSFTDELDLDSVQEVDIMATYTSLQSYKDRVEAFIRKNKSHLVIDKLYKNSPITENELEVLEDFLLKEALESKDRFTKEYGEQPLGKFVRNIIGLDIEVSNQLFANFISKGNLNANQITFIQKMITYLNQNGTIEKSLLTQAPFNENHGDGIFGIFPEEDKVFKIIKVLNQVNENAGFA